MEIEARTRVMYWAPTRRRHYATLRDACRGEAGAIIKNRVWDMGGGPVSFEEQRETGEKETIWRENERWNRVHARLARILERKFRQAATPALTGRRDRDG